MTRSVLKDHKHFPAFCTAVHLSSFRFLESSRRGSSGDTELLELLGESTMSRSCGLFLLISDWFPKIETELQWTRNRQVGWVLCSLDVSPFSPSSKHCVENLPSPGEQKRSRPKQSRRKVRRQKRMHWDLHRFTAWGLLNLRSLEFSLFLLNLSLCVFCNPKHHDTTRKSVLERGFHPAPPTWTLQTAQVAWRSIHLYVTCCVWHNVHKADDVNQDLLDLVSLSEW